MRTPEAAGDPLVLYWLSYGYYLAGRLTEALDNAERGYKLARGQGNRHATTLLANNLQLHALLTLDEGRTREYTRVMEEASHLYDSTAYTFFLIAKGLLLSYQGRWKEVAKHAERWMAQTRLAGSYQMATARFIWAVAQLNQCP